MERHYLPVTFCIPGGGEDMAEETVTVSMVYIEPNAAEPTQDSTKDFTPRVETATVRESARESTPRKPLRTEVRSKNSFCFVLFWFFLRLVAQRRATHRLSISLSDPVCHQIRCNTRSHEVAPGIKIKCVTSIPGVFLLYCKLWRITSLSHIITDSGAILDLTPCAALLLYCTGYYICLGLVVKVSTPPLSQAYLAPLHFFSPVASVTAPSAKCTGPLPFCSFAQFSSVIGKSIHGPRPIPDTLPLPEKA